MIHTTLPVNRKPSSSSSSALSLVGTSMMRTIISLMLLMSSVTASSKSRMEFLHAMDTATRPKNGSHRLVDFQQSLLAKARPYHRPRHLEDAANGDDAVNNNDANNNANYVNEDGLYLTEYALKYVGCQSIHTWSDNLAKDQDSNTVLALERFVVFRLCPADTCSSYNKYGCQYDYGEYMILMEDYLALMAQYHYERYAEYCNTCNDCMTNGGRRQLDDAAGDDAVANDDAVENDDAAAGDDAAAANEDASAVQCQYANACTNYEETCQSYSADEADLEQYFYCAEFEIGNQVAYLGPHCNQDGKTISIGIYSDEYCTQYTGDLGEIQGEVGLSYDPDILSFYFSQSCLSCNATTQWDLYQNDEGGVYDLCEEMYGASAKCNRYLYKSTTYASENQKEMETQVCNFIESLVMKTYDEYGEINLANVYFDMANWQDFTEYVRVVSPVQIFGLVASILLVLVLAGWSCVLHNRLTRKRTWTPPHNDVDPNLVHSGLAAKFSRTHSGIVMNRSRSEGVMA